MAAQVPVLAFHPLALAKATEFTHGRSVFQRFRGVGIGARQNGLVLLTRVVGDNLSVLQ